MGTLRSSIRGCHCERPTRVGQGRARGREDTELEPDYHKSGLQNGPGQANPRFEGGRPSRDSSSAAFTWDRTPVLSDADWPAQSRGPVHRLKSRSVAKATTWSV